MTRWTGIASTRTWPSGSATRTTRFWCSRSFEAARPSRVLDVGFGAGRRVVYLARSGYRVNGIDVSEQGKEYVDHMLASSPEGLVAGPASQVGDGEPGGVGHRVTAMPIREGRGPRPPDGRAGPAV